LTGLEGQRLDKWLWCARLAKSRSFAAKLIEEGCIRVNRRRIVKPSALIKCGDVLTLTLHERVRVIKVCASAGRRGPASEARTLYAEVGTGGEPPQMPAETGCISFAQPGEPARRD
jgi:ribosome-associated heat shock protein Hsp15